MSTIKEVIIGRHNTCPECGHYLWTHDKAGCPVTVVNNITDEYFTLGKCKCNITVDNIVTI